MTSCYSSSLVSATNQVYQSLAQLIKLCDNVLLEGEKAIDEENVAEVLQLVENAVQNLVALAVVKISEQKNKASEQPAKPSPLDQRSSTYSAELLAQRNSLPDIPLTPRERQILEQTSQHSAERHSHHNHSHSSETWCATNRTHRASATQTAQQLERGGAVSGEAASGAATRWSS
ncbi:hypothetical protein LSTR_LSTR015545 [Laodelphax striatellus]|uniref:Vinculin n=1 Tax=Laodelphax striatellus TaxID=195883 RepID=A0A482XT53_LAOST|nr:hypothetical protein LSTR_LSTR015545 [Laodelphax striatellus]